MQTQRAIAVTGPRALTPAQHLEVEREMVRAIEQADKLLAGDATGVDAIALRCASVMGVVAWRFEVDGDRTPWALAERSTRMVRAIAIEGGVLHAFLNKPCPDGVKPCKKWQSAKGSGTWGTIALAVGLGVDVDLHWLIEPQPPAWLGQKQLTLI
jgi:hypothetical protein